MDIMGNIIGHSMQIYTQKTHLFFNEVLCRFFQKRIIYKRSSECQVSVIDTKLHIWCWVKHFINTISYIILCFKSQYFVDSYIFDVESNMSSTLNYYTYLMLSQTFHRHQASYFMLSQSSIFIDTKLHNINKIIA